MIFPSNMKGKGFTLMESVIAIGVVAVLLTTFLAVFGPATQGIRRAISTEDADRLIAAFEKELSILREDEAATYTSAFDKAYDWIEKSSQNGKTGVILINYRSDVANIGNDGKPTPIVGGDEEYVVTATAELFDGNQVSDELGDKLPAAVGPIFFVKTTQLVYNAQGELELGSSGIKPPRQGQDDLGGTGSDSYPEATIAFNAEFFLLPANSQQYVQSFNVNNLGKPLFDRNLAVRR